MNVLPQAAILEDDYWADRDGAAMDALGTSLIALAVVLGGAIGGLWLRKVLPEHYFPDENHLGSGARSADRLGE